MITLSEMSNHNWRLL